MINYSTPSPEAIFFEVSLSISQVFQLITYTFELASVFLSELEKLGLSTPGISRLAKSYETKAFWIVYRRFETQVQTRCSSMTMNLYA